MSKISVALFAILATLAVYAGGTANLQVSYGDAAAVVCTLDPSTVSSRMTLSNGDLTVTRSAVAAPAWASVLSTVGKIDGKFYWELTYNAAVDNGYINGVSETGLDQNNFVGSDSSSFGLQIRVGGADVLTYNGGSGSSTGTVINAVNGDVLSFILDVDANPPTLAVWHEGVAITNGSFSMLDGATYYPAVSLFTAGNSMTANFGATAFAFSPPVGYVGLCE